MATVYAFEYTHSNTYASARAHRPAFATASGATTTYYYYRTAGGADGSTTDPDSIPAGAVVERTVTS